MDIREERIGLWASRARRGLGLQRSHDFQSVVQSQLQPLAAVYIRIAKPQADAPRYPIAAHDEPQLIGARVDRSIGEVLHSPSANIRSRGNKGEALSKLHVALTKTGSATALRGAAYVQRSNQIADSPEQPSNAGRTQTELDTPSEQSATARKIDRTRGLELPNSLSHLAFAETERPLRAIGTGGSILS